MVLCVSTPLQAKDLEKGVDAGERSSRSTGKTHLFVFQVGMLPSQEMCSRVDTCPLCGAADKNLGFSFKFFYEGQTR